MGGGDLVHAVKSQNDRTRRPSWPFNRPKNPLLNLHTHPIGAGIITELLEPAEYGLGFFLRPLADQGDHQLGGFSHCHPGFISHATAAKTINNEFIPIRL